MLEGVPLMATASVCVHRECPSSLLPLQEVSKISKWVRPESLQIIASALGLRVGEICTCLLGVQSLLPTALWFSCRQVPLTFKVRHSCHPSYRIPRLGSSMWSLNPSLLGENFCICDYLPVCGPLTWVCESRLYHISVFPTHLIVIPSLYC